MKLTKDEIEVNEISYEDNQIEWETRISSETNDIAKQIKEQILMNQDIVERLKDNDFQEFIQESIEDYEQTLVDLQNLPEKVRDKLKSRINNLQSILTGDKNE